MSDGRDSLLVRIAATGYEADAVNTALKAFDPVSTPVVEVREGLTTFEESDNFLYKAMKTTIGQYIVSNALNVLAARARDEQIAGLYATYALMFWRWNPRMCLQRSSQTRIQPWSG